MDICIKRNKIDIDRYNRTVKDGGSRSCPHCGKNWTSMVKKCGKKSQKRTNCSKIKTFTFKIQNKSLLISKNIANKKDPTSQKITDGCGQRFLNHVSSNNKGLQQQLPPYLIIVHSIHIYIIE